MYESFKEIPWVKGYCELHEPYYIDEQGMLINGDCLSVIKTIASIDKFKPHWPSLMITDPPYEFVATGGGLHKESESMEKIRELGTDSFDFNTYWPELFVQMARWNKDKINIYVFFNKDLFLDYLKHLIKQECTFDVMIMDRASAPPAHSSHYVSHLEYILFIRRGAATFNGKSDGTDPEMYRKYYRANPGEMNHTDHPNEKPLNLMKRFINVSSNEKDVVIDPFCGSGTTCLAARDTGRFYLGIDKSKEALEMCKLRLRQLTLGI